MSAYLTPDQIVARTAEVTSEFEALLASPRVVRRSRSKQWAFLRHCFAGLFDGRVSDFECTKQNAVQYRFEVESKLRSYYLMRGPQVSLIFRLMHLHTALSMRLCDETYPRTNGYVLLVTADAREAPRPGEEDVRDLLERIVTDATDAEWRVYQALPELDLGPLADCFVVDGPAYKKIQFIATQHTARGWAIRQPEHNPSTKRLLAVKVVAVERERAEVRTKEYWYLRWYSVRERVYVQIDWRETNAQKYILVRRDGRWLVESNHYPPPRGTTPHRKGIVVG